MIHRRRLRPVLALLAVVSVIAVTSSCSSDDPDSSTASTTVPAAAGAITFSTTPDAEWGELAKCPIRPQSTDSSGTPADEGIDGVLQYGKLAQDHVETCVAYPVNPPVGGPHFSVWANCGFYRSPVPEVAAVHVLEHGGVWIAFDPSIDADDVTTIRRAADATTHLLASPYPGLTSKIVMSAWSRQLMLDSTSDPRFQKFIDTYLQGPNTPELGAPCDGGLGTPEPKA